MVGEIKGKLRGKQTKPKTAKRKREKKHICMKKKDKKDQFKRNILKPHDLIIVAIIWLNSEPYTPSKLRMPKS
jgi:hypothetical protein